MESKAKHDGCILVVEDEALVRMTVVDTLEELGFEICEAEDAASALKFLQSRPRVDLMITDLGLPGVNGKKLVEIARALYPALKVLFMTGYGQGEFESGPPTARTRTVKKPFDLDELEKIVLAMLAKA